MTADEAAAMTALTPVPYDSGTKRGKRMIAGGGKALSHVLYQAALAAAHHNPVLKSVTQRLKEHGKPHKLVVVAGANPTLKNGIFWSHQSPT